MIEAFTSVVSHNTLDSLGQASKQMSSLNGQQILPSVVGNNVSFDQVLSEVVEVVGTKLQTAESLSIDRISGSDVGVREVVNSVMEAERSLSTAIALRDKLVQAYLEVSRMQI
ncbi:flagellar hook-basal body complex protein FliE [Bartonella sp. 1-1C]|uniref:flagellar hook-basal body complex protein FliE n=1 Tax=Bartonella sp. 1-1C TaxID=515256 RepID=UPI0001F4BE8C|nr:flagellar hook-basal body complex protein FliE [Bartonella sp. 1-1C]ATO57629.1 flagellar hook-basal body complex protein FliE [Bartonella sp. 1-1C]CBI80612.1 Flagellar hook-basal body complex protein fliE [Bartonella sp. 1-1C]